MRRRLLHALPLFLWVLDAGAAGISPLADYEYTTGSHGYYSHAVSGGLEARFARKKTRLTALYSLFTDSDYSLIQSGTLRARSFAGPDTALSAGLALSGGELRDLSGDQSSVSLDLEAKRYFLDHFEASAGYRYTMGSISAGINREVAVPRGQAAQTRIVRDELAWNYSAHTLAGTAGYEFGRKLRGLYGLVRLAVTFNSDRSNTYSQGAEASLPLPRLFSLGSSYTLTQNNAGDDRSYLSFFASKQF